MTEFINTDDLSPEERRIKNIPVFDSNRCYCHYLGHYFGCDIYNYRVHDGIRRLLAVKSSNPAESVSVDYDEFNNMLKAEGTIRLKGKQVPFLEYLFSGHAEDHYKAFTAYYTIAATDTL